MADGEKDLTLINHENSGHDCFSVAELKLQLKDMQQALKQLHKEDGLMRSVSIESLIEHITCVKKMIIELLLWKGVKTQENKVSIDDMVDSL